MTIDDQILRLDDMSYYLGDKKMTFVAGAVTQKPEILSRIQEIISQGTITLYFEKSESMEVTLQENISDPSGFILTSPVPDLTSESPHKDPITQLDNMLKRPHQLPVVSVTEHITEQGFQYNMTVTYRGNEYVGNGEATSKKGAKRAASVILLSALAEVLAKEESQKQKINLQKFAKCLTF